jgi:DNA-binding PadR family transcriptional regulator
MSLAALTVLHAVGSGVGHGFDIIDATGLPGGTVYPALSRLERDGLVSSSWEDHAIARGQGRPPRRYYVITPAGRREANDALARVHALKPLRAPRTAGARSRS